MNLMNLMNNFFEFNCVNFFLPNKIILEKITFSIEKRGQCVCLLGPSGVGKTTILKSIAGLKLISSGEITLNKKILSNQNTFIEPEKRNISLSFQDNALFPHLNIEENIKLGITKNKNASFIFSKDELMNLFYITELKKKYPHEISAGEAQRACVVRSICRNPDLLLLDEPFANLDQNLKEKIQDNLKLILKKSGLTSIIVTHDKNEAFYLGDYCGILLNKKLVQFDTPYNIHHKPNSREIVEFFNRGVLLPAKVTGKNSLFNEDLGEIKGEFTKSFSTNQSVNLLIQPEDLIYDEKSELKFDIIEKKFRGANFIYILKTKNNKKIPVLVHSHNQSELLNANKFGIKKPIYIDHLICF